MLLACSLLVLRVLPFSFPRLKSPHVVGIFYRRLNRFHGYIYFRKRYAAVGAWAAGNSSNRGWKKWKAR